MSLRLRRVLIAALGLLVLAGVYGYLRYYEPLLVLADIMAGERPSRWKQLAESPRRQSVAFGVNGRERMTGDLYLPAHAEPAAGIVLVPGAVPQGKDDPRLVAFATTLARARFAVLAPALSGVRELRVRPSDAREVAEAFAWLASRTDLAPAGRAGIGAFSYAAGPAVLAALEPDIRERVRFIMALGGYHDLYRAVRFFTTGYFEEDGKARRIEPDDYGRLVFAYGAKAYLHVERDHELIDAIAERKRRDRAADIADLVAGFSPQGMAVYELAVNSDPARFAPLLAALPPAMLADLEALSLHNKDLGRLRARLLLVHGRNDNLIPYPETLALAQAAPAGTARVWLIGPLLGHVDLSLGRVLSWQFFSQALPDMWRMLRAVDALLGERERQASAMDAPVGAGLREDTRPRTHAMRRPVKRAREASAAPRILLLTSTLGSGHLRAAQALEAALRERSPAPIVQTLDFWSLIDAGVAQVVRESYLRLVQERPELYERIYQLDERTWRRILESNGAPPPALAEGLELLAATAQAASAGPGEGGAARLDRLLFRLLCAVLPERARRSSRNGALARRALIKWGWARLARRLQARLRAFSPDALIATQMCPAALASFVKRRRGLNIPLIGVLTDFGIHNFWIQPGIDRYCLAHDAIAGLHDAAIERARICVTGIPLMPGFRNPPDVQQARLQLGLGSDARVVLVLGGGLGLGVEAIAGRLLANTARLEVLVLAGSNASARDALAPLLARHPSRLRVWDWTEQTEVFMRAADLVVGKPGGLTLAEALACGRPLWATHCLRGQEGFNVRFLEQHGVGRLVAEGELAASVEALFADPGELARLQDRAGTLGRRDAAASIAELALEHARLRSARAS